MSSPAASSADEPESMPAFSFIEEVDQRLVDVAAGTYSGKIVEQERAKCEAIMQGFAMGIGKKRLAQQFGVGVKTIRAMVARWEAAGKLAPLKQRLSGKLGAILEMGADIYLEALEEGRIKPDQIPVAYGIFSDKKALLDGEATARVERTEGPTVRDVIERMKRVKGVIDLPTDSE